MTAKYKTDRVWGIERNPDSPAFGDVVVGSEGQMPIILWALPACDVAPHNVTGGLSHGDRVTVLSKTLRSGTAYYKVRANIIHEKKKYTQAGWVANTLLKKAGANE